jgi:diguanylate cyclase (GGDEF)-like protein
VQFCQGQAAKQTEKKQGLGMPQKKIPANGKARVLVTDDSRVIRMAVVKILGDKFEVIEAEDGEACWERLLPDDQVQLLITDIEMPRLDGYNLLCRIRAHDQSRLRDLPVIVITGAEDETTRERAFACGATDFITKPIDSVQLLARARAHTHGDEASLKLSEVEVALEEQSANDALTGLHSRRYFLQRGAQDLAFTKRRDTELSIVRIDIDNFRNLYDTHGTDVSDAILKWLAKIITASIRTEDTAARLRGAQFAVLLPDTGRMEGAVLAERIRTTVAATPFAHGPLSLPVTVSLGIATLGRDPGDNIEELLASADRAMTLAKAAGGNRLGVSYLEELPTPEIAVMAQPSLESALSMIAKGEGGKLTPYLPDLVASLLPLLEFGDRNLDLGLSFDIESLKERLSELK